MNFLEVKVLHLTNIVFIIAIRIVFPLMDLSRNRSPTVCLGQEKELKRSNIFRLTQLRHHHDCGFPIKMTNREQFLNTDKKLFKSWLQLAQVC